MKGWITVVKQGATKGAKWTDSDGKQTLFKNYVPFRDEINK